MKLYAFYFICSSTIASVAYYLLNLIMPDGWVFGALYRMFLYHWEHPFQYIILACIIYAFCASLGVIWFPNLIKWKQKIFIMAVIMMTILISSVPGGVLWKIHDMQAGRFTEGEQFWLDLYWGAEAGLCLGWAIILLSIPYNIICVAFGYFVTKYGFDIYHRDKRKDQKS